MYTEASGQSRGDKARLQSPLQQPATGGKCLEFWYHMLGNQMGSLAVYIKDSTQNSQVWKKTGNQGSLWQKGRVTLKSARNFWVIYFLLSCLYKSVKLLDTNLNCTRPPYDCLG